MNSELFSKIFEGVRWVWLDLDDTLIDFHTNSRVALGILYRRQGLDRFYPTPQEWIETYEKHNKMLWERYALNQISQEFLRLDRFATPLRGAWSDSEERLEEFSRRLDPLYLDLLASQKQLVDGAVQLLESLRTANYKIGVLSNGFTRVQHRKLEVTGLDKKVDLVVLSDDIGVNKPDTRLFMHAMERAGDEEPAHHLMIGDNPVSDIGGAVNAGWKGIFLNGSSPEGERIMDDGKVVEINSLRLVADHIDTSKGS